MYLELDAVFGNDGARKSIQYDFEIDDDEMIASPVSVSGEIFNKAGIVTLCANAEYVLNAICARCNAPISKQTKVCIDHCLIPHAENDENDYYIVVDNMRLDLDALIREDIYLSMPSRFLCKESCKGLCSICGADLNKTTCACRKTTDPRWDVLKDIF